MADTNNTPDGYTHNNAKVLFGQFGDQKWFRVVDEISLAKFETYPEDTDWDEIQADAEIYVHDNYGYAQE